MTSPHASLGVGVCGNSPGESEFVLQSLNALPLWLARSLRSWNTHSVLGHDWRPGGIAEAVFGAVTSLPGNARTTVLLGWPGEAGVNMPDPASLKKRAFEIEPVLLPEELRSHERRSRSEGLRSASAIYLRARGLTAMRRRMAAGTDALICFGGRIHGSAGRYPGVIEEAFLAQEQRRPLYLIGAVDGAVAHLIRAVRGADMPADFCSENPITRLFESPPVSESDPRTAGDREIDRVRLWKTFRDLGTIGLARANGLTELENIELFDTPLLDRIVGLIQLGLSRIQESSAPVAN